MLLPSCHKAAAVLPRLLQGSSRAAAQLLSSSAEALEEPAPRLLSSCVAAGSLRLLEEDQE